MACKTSEHVLAVVLPGKTSPYSLRREVFFVFLLQTAAAADLMQSRYLV